MNYTLSYNMTIYASNDNIGHLRRHTTNWYERFHPAAFGVETYPKKEYCCSKSDLCLNRVFSSSWFAWITRFCTGIEIIFFLTRLLEILAHVQPSGAISETKLEILFIKIYLSKAPNISTMMYNCRPRISRMLLLKQKFRVHHWISLSKSCS